MLEDSQQAISFSKDHFRSAISCALQILGAEPLKSSPSDPGGVRCIFPAMDQRDGADPTWAETMDSLRAPRPRDQKLWEWRRTSPIRPVVFEDPGVVTNEVVQLHLEQRAVQRLLSRFTAQGFVYHDLSASLYGAKCRTLCHAFFFSVAFLSMVPVRRDSTRSWCPSRPVGSTPQSVRVSCLLTAVKPSPRP